MPDDARVVGAVLDDEGNLSSLVVEQEDHTTSELSVTPKGVPIIRAFPFAFDTPDLLTGVEIYTPTVGEILFETWIEVVEEWNGTTPQCDVGTFVETDNGWWSWWYYPVSLESADYPQVDDNSHTGQSTSTGGPHGLVGSGLSFNAAHAQSTYSPYKTYRGYPAKFVSDDPIKVVVSQDGSSGGDDPESTQGSAILYLVTATPA